MKTFEQLREQTTPDIIKKMAELAEGFELDTDGDNIGIKDPFDNFYYFEDDIPKNMETFPLLLHRAVEGWNKINPCKPIQILCNCISFITDEDDPASVEWGYDNEQYEPCHLTQCEMAIWDCLLNILKQEERDE